MSDYQEWLDAQIKLAEQDMRFLERQLAMQKARVTPVDPLDPVPKLSGASRARLAIPPGHEEARAEHWVLL